MVLERALSWRASVAVYSFDEFIRCLMFELALWCMNDISSVDLLPNI